MWSVTYRFARTLQPFWPYMRPYRDRYLSLIAAQIIVTLLATVPPLLAKAAIDNGIRPGRLDRLAFFCLASIGVAVVAGILNWMLEYGHEGVSAKFTASLREGLFSNIQSRPYTFFGSISVGTLQGRLNDDAEAIYTIIVNLCLNVLNESLQIAVISAVLIWVDWRIALLVLASLPLMLYIVNAASRQLKKLSLDTRAASVALLAFIQNRLSNIYLIKSLRREQEEEKTYKFLNEKAVAATLARVRVRFTFLFLAGVLTSVVPIVLLWFGGSQVISHRLTFGSLVACYLYSVRLFTPLQDMISHMADIASSLASADLLQEYTAQNERRSINLIFPLTPSNSGIRVDFVRVTFIPESTRTPILHELSASIAANEKIAVVGASGSGKTTLANLMARLYLPTHGQINIDGISIDQFSDAAYAKLVGIAPQDAQLFDISIFENIRLGRPSARSEEVLDAARRMRIHDEIMQLPDGYNTIIGTHGIRLSGGQRQRIALTRLFLQKPAVMILDEATSGLDRSTEAAVLTELVALQSTTILITHRESVTSFAQRTFSLSEGSLSTCPVENVRSTSRQTDDQSLASLYLAAL